MLLNISAHLTQRRKNIGGIKHTVCPSNKSDHYFFAANSTLYVSPSSNA